MLGSNSITPEHLKEGIQEEEQKFQQVVGGMSQ